MNNKNLVIFLTVSIIVVLLILSTVRSFSRKGIKEENVQGELKEYNGEKLSSVLAFRENSIIGPQKVDISSYELEVVNTSGNSKSYKYNKIVEKFNPIKKVVKLYCVEGWDVKVLFEGILVKELLQEVGVSDTDKIVILHSVDGYTTSLPVSYFLENDILLGYKINGITLPEQVGFPFQLVAEGKWGYKWARWVNKIELSSDIDYKGFCESRGYSNSGDLDKPFFGED